MGLLFRLHFLLFRYGFSIAVRLFHLFLGFFTFLLLSAYLAHACGFVTKALRKPSGCAKMIVNFVLANRLVHYLTAHLAHTFLPLLATHLNRPHSWLQVLFVPETRSTEHVL